MNHCATSQLTDLAGLSTNFIHALPKSLCATIETYLMELESTQFGLKPNSTAKISVSSILALNTSHSATTVKFQ